jgi:CheY-like chemotaxis protein
LIVEDKEDSAEALRMLLEAEGHEVFVALTAASGLRAAREHDPEIVLCDIGLPGDMDGYAFARTFRADPKLQSKALVALTGHGLPSDQQRATAAGFDMHLTKPIDPSALLELIDSLAVSVV